MVLHGKLHAKMAHQSGSTDGHEAEIEEQAEGLSRGCEILARLFDNRFNTIMKFGSDEQKILILQARQRIYDSMMQQLLDVLGTQ